MPSTPLDQGVVNADGDVEYKSSSQFASHLQIKSEAVSDFAKSKSIKQQREFLPVYQCRSDLLRVIKENTGLCLTCINK